MGPQLLVEPGKATFFSSGSLSTLSQSDFWSFASRSASMGSRLVAEAAKQLLELALERCQTAP
jgi:hypothetical protein